jgi:hypothetical protein
MMTFIAFEDYFDLVDLVVYVLIQMLAGGGFSCSKPFLVFVLYVFIMIFSAVKYIILTFAMLLLIL